jgi:hypothetical protein
MAAALAAGVATAEAAEPVPLTAVAAEFISVSGERRFTGAASPRREDMSERASELYGRLRKVVCRWMGR